MKELLYLAIGTSFLFIMSCVGASVVFFFHKTKTKVFKTIFLGFAAGIMISAAVFGLLVPAIEEANKITIANWLPIAGGFSIGVLFLYLLDKIIPHLHPASNITEGLPTSMKRISLLLFAIVLHHIPEGMAVGSLFIYTAKENIPLLQSPAFAIIIGIGIHNIPESAAISVTLKQEGISTPKSFLLGCLSGITGPIFCFLMIFIGSVVDLYMPWLLSFAAGAMLYVVIEELIPESRIGEHSNYGTISVMIGFILMLMLEILVE
ncbi:MAG: ZIP family metal transporter [Bacteroidetes bacterium]|nr:ZIP family metal transporter [Bacteroidota bacterium]